MTDLQHLIAQIDRLDNEATEGPWTATGNAYGGKVYEPTGYPLPGCTSCGENEATYEGQDAEFIALARTFTPAASRALRDVLKTLDQYLVKFDQDNMEDHIVHGIVHELRNKIQDQF